MKAINTTHSMERLEQRAGIVSVREQQEIATRAKKSGRSKRDFDGDFREYLERNFKRKSNNTRIKVYTDLIFIFGGADKNKLITVVKVPEKFREKAMNPKRDTRQYAWK